MLKSTFLKFLAFMIIMIVAMFFMDSSLNKGETESVLNLFTKQHPIDLNHPTKTILLTNDNLVIFRSEFTPESISQLIEDLKEIDSDTKSDYPIYLYLVTPGGSITAGLNLYSFVRSMNRPVHTISNFAASMGFQTVQQLGLRYITEYGVIMSHKAKTSGFGGEFGDGKSQLDAKYRLWLRIIEILDRQTIERTKGKQTLDSYRKSYENELWLLGNEAVTQGYADEVVDLKCDSSLDDKTIKIEQALILGLVNTTVLISKCPTNPKIIKNTLSLLTNEGSMELNEFTLKNPSFLTCQQTATLNMPLIPCIYKTTSLEEVLQKAEQYKHFLLAAPQNMINKRAEGRYKYVD